MSSSSAGIDLEDILRARSRIASRILQTPLFPATKLSEDLDANIFLKLEHFQRTGTFRERGFLNALLNLHESGTQCVVTAPSFNGAYTTTRLAPKLGLSTCAVLPKTTNMAKVHNLSRFDVEIHLMGGSNVEAAKHGENLAQERGLPFLHPSRSLDIVCGYGTIGLELTEQIGTQNLDYVLCPVTSGALVSAVAIAVKSLSPKTKIIGIEPESANDVYNFFKGQKKRRHPLVDSNILEDLDRPPIADVARETIPNLVDDLITVSDEAINRALVHLIEKNKTVCEIEAATAIAALVDKRMKFKGKTVVAIVTSGNLDINLLTRVVDRGLVKSGRLSRMNVLLSDEPGALEKLASLLATHEANILQVSHDRIFSRTPLAAARCELTIATRGQQHVTNLLKALEKQGYSYTVST